MRKAMYFGRPICFYNTPHDSFLMRRICIEFPEYDIEDSAKEHHQRGYAVFRETTGRGMNYFLMKVIPLMDAGTFRAFDDGMFGTGVFDEAESLMNRKKPVYEIDRSGMLQTVTKLDPARKLTPEMTRKRLDEIMRQKA